MCCVTDNTATDCNAHVQAAAAEGQKRHAKQLQAMEAAYERRQAAQVTTKLLHFCIQLV
jgi:hypothetical protein